MAFTIYQKEEHNEKLKTICKNLGGLPKNKAVLWMIENFQELEIDRRNLLSETYFLKEEIKELKELIKMKVNIDERLKEITGEQNER